MKLFQTEDHYYDHGMRDYAPQIRLLYYVIIGILIAFSKVM